MLIRFKNLGLFKKHHIDGANLRYSMQKLVNSLRFKYDPLTTPPVLHRERYGPYGKRLVAKNQLLPQEIIQKSWVLSKPAYFEHFTRACRARVQLENTWNIELRDELEETMTHGPLEIAHIKETLAWMIQMIPSWWLLAMLAVM